MRACSRLNCLRRRRPSPRLVVKAVAVTTGTVALLLVLVFLVVRMRVRDQVRRTVTQHLDSSQRMLDALESRRRQALRMQAGSDPLELDGGADAWREITGARVTARRWW